MIFLARDDEIEFRSYDFTKLNEDDNKIADLFNEEVKILRENKLAFDNHTNDDDPMDIDIDHLDRMLSSILNTPRSHQHDQENEIQLKTEIGGYIWAKLGMLGFVSGVQTFRDRRVKNGPLGSNLIGLLPGTEWGTGKDKVRVVTKILRRFMWRALQRIYSGQEAVYITPGLDPVSSDPLFL